MISGWKGIHAEGAYGTENHISVNEGDDVTLDCDLTGAGVMLQYPVYWEREGIIIAIKEQNHRPYILSKYSHLRFSVKYTNSGAHGRRLSLVLHQVESYHAGEYKCYDDAHRCQSRRHLCKTFHVSVVACNCSLNEVLAGINDNRVGVKCIFEGFQSPHAGNTSVNVTLDSSTVQGIVESNILTTHVEDRKLCKNLTMEFNLNPRFPYMIQCQVPRKNPCPYHGSTGITPAAILFLEHSPKSTGTIGNHTSSSVTSDNDSIYRTSLPSAPITVKETTIYRTSSSPVVSGYDTRQRHTSLSSTRFTGTETIPYETSSSSLTSGYGSTQHRDSLSSAPGDETITFHTSSSSKFKKHILITSITVVIVSIIVAVVTLCLTRRRNERSHKPYCREPGTKQLGDKAHPTSSVDGKRDQSVDLVNETCEKTALSEQAYYANFKGTNHGARYQEDDSRIDLSTITSDRMTKPPTTQPFISTQINQDTGSCSSHQIPVSQESSNSCSQYESVDVDFHGGIEPGHNMAGARVAYHEIILDPSDVSSQYQPLHLYEGTGGDVPCVTHQQQLTHESSAPLSQYGFMDFPLATDEAENGDTHLYAACDEKPPCEKEKIKMEESSKGSIDESGTCIHVYANFDKRPRYGRNTKP